MYTISITRRSFVQQFSMASAAFFIFPSGVLGSESVESYPIRKAMDKLVRCCLAGLNPVQQYLPTGGYEVAHDTGRWWDALLHYEASSGFRIPQQAEDAMMKKLRMLTDNKAALLTWSVCNPHNLRETMLSYTALVRFRKSEWARIQGLRPVETMDHLLESDGQLNCMELAELTGKPLTNDLLMMQKSPTGQWFGAVGSTGRAPEAIVWFYEATGNKTVLDLARRLAEIHLRNNIDPSGKERPELVDPKQVSHTHSYCGTLRGLLLLGFSSGEKQYIEAVKNTYLKGIWGTSISYSGWTPHDQGKIRFPDQYGDPIGEHASCGDVVQIALWLALHDGQTDLLDDVERLIRSRLLPSQTVDLKNPKRDGAWGVYGHPFGRGETFDVFAAILHTLADVYKNIVTTAPDGTLSVNLNFNIDMPMVSVLSKRNKSASLYVTPKYSAPLRIRVPSWASRKSVRLFQGDKTLPLHWDGSYLVVRKRQVSVGKTITLQHDLPEKETVEEMPVSHRQFHLSWRGDEVIACNPEVDIYSTSHL